MKSSIRNALLMAGAFIGLVGPMHATAQSAEQRAGPDYQLFLIGDELQLCSSLAWTECFDTDWLDPETMRTERYINLVGDPVKALLDDENWPIHRHQIRDDVKDAIAILYERLNIDVVTEHTFHEEFTRRVTNHLYNSLSEREWHMILDHLELPAPAGKPNLAQIRMLKVRAKEDILRAMLAEADKVRGADQRAPRIAITAAGARDPFTTVEPYLNALEKLGAEVRWLPIDAAVNRAQRTKQCDDLEELRVQELHTWRRAAVFPALHEHQVAFCKAPLAGPKIVDWADAVLIVGNNQNLVRKAFLDPMSQPTDLMTSIALKMRANRLVVAATGDAMNALTAKAMVAGGLSEEALRAGAIAGEAPAANCDRDDTCPRSMNVNSAAYHPLGGVGLFTLATLDSRFSDLGRHGRLLRVAAANKVPLAVGVDRRTALAVNVLTGDFKVVGERGVFLAEAPQETEKAVATTFHYLVGGASGRFTANSVTDIKFATGEGVVAEAPTTRFLNDRGMVDTMRLLCQGRDSVNLIENEFRLLVVADDNTQRQRSGGECQVSHARVGLSWQPERW